MIWTLRTSPVIRLARMDLSETVSKVKCDILSWSFFCFFYLYDCFNIFLPKSILFAIFLLGSISTAFILKWPVFLRPWSTDYEGLDLMGDDSDSSIMKLRFGDSGSLSGVYRTAPCRIMSFVCGLSVMSADSIPKSSAYLARYSESSLPFCSCIFII